MRSDDIESAVVVCLGFPTTVVMAYGMSLQPIPNSLLIQKGMR